MEICEAFGLSMCPFDPMLKGLRGSGPTKGLPNASSAPPTRAVGGLHQKSRTGLDLGAQAAYWPSSQSSRLAMLAT